MPETNRLPERGSLNATCLKLQHGAACGLRNLQRALNRGGIVDRMFLLLCECADELGSRTDA
jgi:hypothetical protein